MNSAELRDRCLSFAGAEETFPFNPETSVFKVGGKMFALSRLGEEAVQEMIEGSCDLFVSKLPKAERTMFGWTGGQATRP